MIDIFFKDKEQYNNALSPVKGYIEQLASYISNKRSIPIEEAKLIGREFLKKHFKDKNIKHFHREENGDRVVKETTLLSYINDNIRSKNIFVPTFTAYMNPSIKKSILSEFILQNVKKRSVAKKQAHVAKVNGDMDLYDAKSNEQNNLKIYNNSLSGAFAQEACVLHNPTAHSTLTSITRTITSLSNASNEKLIAGNRYYPRGIDILNNIIYITTYANVSALKEVIIKYSLYLPTVNDTVDVLRYSSDLYFVDKPYYDRFIIPYLTKLNKYQLAAICYYGDLYHIRKYNSSFVKNMLDELISPIYSKDTSQEVVSNLSKINENILNFVHLIFFSELKGLGKDYESIHKHGKAANIYYTALHVIETFIKYKDFYNCLFMTEVFPNNSYRLKNMRRRTVVLSDTDSTCYTLDEWVKWYHGNFHINSNTIAVAGCIGFIASQAIVNQLAILSKSMNVSTENLNALAMKNEYLWLAHAPAEVSKHYFAYTVMQEGNIFSKPDIEIKGVWFKNSSVPTFVIEDSKELMTYILEEIANNRKVQFNRILTRVINLEKNIKESVLRGEPLYLKKSKIKDKDAYALDETKSPFQRHVFWEEVFAHKYGQIPPPPYDVIKLPTTVTSRVTLNAWVQSIEDLTVRDKLNIWLEKCSKKNLPTIYLNDMYVLGNGIPKELLSIIDLRRIIFDVTVQHRLIIETLGIMLNDEKTVSEQFDII